MPVYVDDITFASNSQAALDKAVQRFLTFHHHHLPPSVHFPLLISLSRSPFLVYILSPLLPVEPPAPGMAPKPSGPPGLLRPRSSPASSSPPAPNPPLIFSPTPSQPRSSWFQLLSSPAPPPVPFVASAVVSPLTEVPFPLPHVDLTHATCQSTAITANNGLITNLTSSGPIQPLTTTDPWTRAHVRVCAHANDECAACSISVVCCSCRALRYTPGPPPASPALDAPALTRSRSASPSLFRDVGNAPTPPGFYDGPEYDDEAYARAYAESDTCDNSSCPPTGEYRLRFYPELDNQCPTCPGQLMSRSHILFSCNRYVPLSSSLTNWRRDRHNDKSWKSFFTHNVSAFTFGDLPDDVH